MRSSLFGNACVSILSLFAMAVAGCERMRAPPKVAETYELICEPARLSLTAGASGVLTARAIDARGRTIDRANVQFSASDPRFLRVTAQGEVKSLGPAGQSSILITSGSRILTVPVSVLAGPAHRFETLEPMRRAIVAGAASRVPVKVRLLDAFVNPVSSVPVVFKAGIDPPLSLSTTTDADGVAAIVLPTITRAGHFILEVHESRSQQVSLALDMQVDAAAPAVLVPVKVPASGPVALIPYFELVLQVCDAFGNPVPDAQVRWRTGSRSRSFDPPQSKSGPDGKVRTRWQLTELKGRRATLRAFVVGHEKIRFETWIALER